MTTTASLTILQLIQQWDRQLLMLINFDGSAAYDRFWMLYTNGLTWVPLAAVVIWCLLRRGGWRHALLITLVLCLLFVISDFVVASLIKPLVGRIRPSHDAQVMNLLSYVDNYHGGRFGFPSNHASNGFAVATMLALIFRRPLVIFSAFLWAIGSCYSRMYLGVHYPSDILTGAAIGALAAVGLWYAYRWVYNHFAIAWHFPGFATLYRHSRSWLISLTFLLSVVVLLLCSLVQQTR